MSNSTKRNFLNTTLWAAALLAAGCAVNPTAQPSAPAASGFTPVVMVHGNGDTAALWQTTVWRFESNGWPRERLHAIHLPYPSSRDDDSKPQPGRSSTAEHMAFVKAEVEAVLAKTGAKQVVLLANSRGGNAVRNYVQNGGGWGVVSHAVLGGTPNHGVWAIPGFREANEFAGTGPFLTSLNAPKNAAGDEVLGPTKWLTIRSDNNDKFAQPDGLWIGAKGTPTRVSYAGPELKGATNVVIANIDHRETSYSPAAFEATYRFITGTAPKTTGQHVVNEAAPVLNGKVMGLGLKSDEPASGNFSNNLPLAAATVRVFAVNAATGERQGAATHTHTTAADGVWGPFTAKSGQAYEFEITAAGYASTHVYRSGFARSGNLVHLRAERLSDADKKHAAVVNFVRPRGYFDPQRDTMSFDGQTALPGLPAKQSGPGPHNAAGSAASKMTYPQVPQRAIAASFNGENIVARAWPIAEGRVTTIELHE